MPTHLSPQIGQQTRKTEDPHLRSLIQRFTPLEIERRLHENAIQEIVDLMQPFRGDIVTRKPVGGKRVQGVFDSTATIAAQNFVNFLKGTILPSTTDWVVLSPPVDHQGNLDIKDLLDSVTAKVHRALSDSNFYVQATAGLRDLSIIGNMALSVEPGPRSLNTRGDASFGRLSFEAVQFSRIWWTLDRNSIPILVVRLLPMVAVDAIQFFKLAEGSVVHDIADRNPMEQINVFHYCYRRSLNIVPAAGVHTNKPWVSDFILEHKGKPLTQLKQTGNRFCPYVVARWTVVDGEQYGRGQGHLIRGVAKGTNELKRQYINSTARDLNPPLMHESNAAVQLNSGPGGITVLKTGRQAPQFLRSGSDYAAANKTMEDDKAEINAAFLADLISDPETQPRSAEESRIRRDKAIARLAGTADILDTEFLGPTIERVIEIMRVQKALPELDEIATIVGGPARIPISYSSPFFTALKAQAALKMQALVERRANLAQILGDPSIMDQIDLDAFGLLDAALSDVPAEMFRDEAEVAEIRQSRAEARANQQAIEALKAVPRQGTNGRTPQPGAAPSRLPA